MERCREILDKMNERWNKMTPEDRIVLIRKNKIISQVRWSTLARQWALRSWEQMSDLQKEAIAELFQANGNEA